MTATLWHVRFDGKPAVVCHVCPRHKAIADRLPCDDDKGTNGECAHVQYTACACDEAQCCVACGEVAA